jgi:flagellar motor switch protein FliM
MSDPQERGVSDDRIAALVAAAREGRLEEGGEERRRTPAVKRMSFTRPTKFNHDLQRRLARSHETFSRKVAGRLAAELRVPVDVEVISLTQHTWANAHAELPASSVCAVLEAADPRTRMLLSSELTLVLSLIERMLGGDVTAAPRERKLSDIDWALTRRVFEDLTEDLSAIWKDAADLDLGLAGFESQADSAELSLVSEPTLAITAEVRIASASSTLTLLIPYRSIEPVAERLTAGGRRDAAAEPEDRRRMSGALSGVEVELRAEVAALEMPLSAVAALAPGDLIEFDGLAAEGVTLMAGAAPIGSAMPGQSSGRRAVQLTGRSELRT